MYIHDSCDHWDLPIISRSEEFAQFAMLCYALRGSVATTLQQSFSFRIRFGRCHTHPGVPLTARNKHFGAAIYEEIFVEMTYQHEEIFNIYVIYVCLHQGTSNLLSYYKTFCRETMGNSSLEERLGGFPIVFQTNRWTHVLWLHFKLASVIMSESSSEWRTHQKKTETPWRQGQTISSFGSQTINSDQ